MAVHFLNIFITKSRGLRTGSAGCLLLLCLSSEKSSENDAVYDAPIESLNISSFPVVLDACVQQVLFIH